MQARLILPRTTDVVIDIESFGGSSIFFFFLPDLFVFSSRLLEKKDALNFVESITFFLFPLVCFNVEMT